jgi:hypothetical protein
MHKWCTNPRRINLVRRCTTLLCHQYWNCFVSPFWFPEFWGSFKVMENLWTPVIHRWPVRDMINTDGRTDITTSLPHTCNVRCATNAHKVKPQNISTFHDPEETRMRQEPRVVADSVRASAPSAPLPWVNRSSLAPERHLTRHKTMAS